MVFGAGALGSVLGGFLSTRNDVTLIGRLPHVNKIKKFGLRISGIWGNHVFHPKAYTSVDEVEEVPDLVIITTKSYDTPKAVDEIVKIAGPDTYVMSMQNGIGNEEKIAEKIGKERTLGGMAIFGAVLVEPGHSKVTVYASECLIGSLTENIEIAEKIAEVFRESGIPALPTDDIIREKWMKAFYNIALNSLSSILMVKYGFLGRNKEAIKIMEDLIREAFQVAEAEGVNLKYTWEEYLDYFLKKQLPPTAEHESSMLQDIRRGKKTEIDYLNGAIVRLGKKHGIPTPANRIVTYLVKLLEKKRRE